MADTPPVLSLAELGSEAGARAGQHMNLSFRRLMEDAEQTEHYVRQITGEAHPFGNIALVVVPGDEALAAAVAKPLISANFPAALIYPVGVSDEVRSTVYALGFTENEIDPAMAVEIAVMPAVTLPDEYVCTRVVDGIDAQAWAETLALGYGLPIGVARLFSPLGVPPEHSFDAEVQFFGVLSEGRMVATSMLHLADGLAGVYCVAVLESERGKGLGAFVTAHALQMAAQLGYRVGVLQSSAAGHSVYRRLGFKDVGEVQLFIRLPQPTPEN